MLKISLNFILIILHPHQCTVNPPSAHYLQTLFALSVVNHLSPLFAKNEDGIQISEGFFHFPVVSCPVYVLFVPSTLLKNKTKHCLINPHCNWSKFVQYVWSLCMQFSLLPHQQPPCQLSLLYVAPPHLSVIVFGPQMIKFPSLLIWESALLWDACYCAAVVKCVKNCRAYYGMFKSKLFFFVSPITITSTITVATTATAFVFLVLEVWSFACSLAPMYREGVQQQPGLLELLGQSAAALSVSPIVHCEFAACSMLACTYDLPWF